MKAIYFLSILILLLTVACKKKEYPKPAPVAESEFYFKLLVDGQAQEIVAGKDNYFMFSSIGRDTSNIYSLISEFKQAGCSSCLNSLRFQIHDSKKTAATSSVDVASVLQLKKYKFLAGNSDSLFSKVTIQYTDANGNTFSSSNSLQPKNSLLELLAIDNFSGLDAKGTVKKVKLKFNCMVYNGSKSIAIECSDAAIALMY